jgi:hypothetical protein
MDKGHRQPRGSDRTDLSSDQPCAPAWPRLTRRTLLRASLALTGAAMLGGAGRVAGATGGADGGTDVVLRWNALALAAIRAGRVAPPVAARALAILHTAIYDAWAAYDDRALGTQLGAALRRSAPERTTRNTVVAISTAAHRAVADLFPAFAGEAAALLADLGAQPPTGRFDAASPFGVGERAATALLAFRHRDGANQFGDLAPGGTPYADYTGYAPVNTPDELRDPDRWQPLRVPDGRGGTNVQRCLTPHWGLVVPFALRSGDEFRPAEGPARHGSRRYAEGAAEVLAISAALDDRAKAIAEYWADGPGSETPPGHWNVIAAWVSRRDGHDLDATVKLFFILNNALLDASIACWDCKMAFDSTRPISAIRHLYAGQPVRAWGGPGKGTMSIDGGAWQPYQSPTFVTPPFPEYASGHSTFSRAAAETLRRFTGGDRFGWSHTMRAGSSRIEPGSTPATEVTLSWATFGEAADEAGMSRLYGGIHFADGNAAGQELGRLVAARTWGRARALIGSTGGAGA